MHKLKNILFQWTLILTIFHELFFTNIKKKCKRINYLNEYYIKCTFKKF